MSLKPGDLIQKDPSAIVPKGFDWTAWLAELGDTVIIATSTYAVSTVLDDAAPLTLSGALKVSGNLKTQVTLSGGTVGYRYTVTNRIVTTTGVQDERSFRVKVEDR